MTSGVPCLDENEALAFLKGQISREASISAQHHVATCSTCQDLLALILEHSFIDHRAPDEALDASLTSPSTASPSTASPSTASPSTASPSTASPSTTSTLPDRVGLPDRAPMRPTGEPRQTSSLIGRWVGNFVVTGFFGKGGMGEVYLATHPQIGRQVAVKVLRAPSPELTHRFLREARILATLRHANVVEVYDFGQLDDGQLYYTMEPLWGRSLDDVARKLAPMRAADVVPYLEQICGGLQAAHDAGVVHRDLKPGNVIVLQARPLALKLVDFGLARTDADADADAEADAKDEAQITSPGLVLGTPQYLAPEQALGDHDQVSARTDLYALGVLLHVLLSGRAPFRARTVTSLVAQHIEAPPPRLEEAPRAVADVVLRCLAKDPAKRPSSAREVSEAFQAALLPARGTPGASRRGRALLAWVGALALLAAVIIITWRSSTSVDPPPSPPAAGAAVHGPDRGAAADGPGAGAAAQGPDRGAAANLPDRGAAADGAAGADARVAPAPRPTPRPGAKPPRRIGEGTLPF